MNYFCDSETEAITQIAFNSDSACEAINYLISPAVNSLHRYEVTTAATVARPSRENRATHESILRNITSRNWGILLIHSDLTYSKNRQPPSKQDNERYSTLDMTFLKEKKDRRYVWYFPETLCIIFSLIFHENVHLSIWRQQDWSLYICRLGRGEGSGGGFLLCHNEIYLIPLQLWRILTILPHWHSIFHSIPFILC